MSKHIIVTGGAGYIGSHICKVIAARGDVPVVLDNLSHGHEELAKFGPLHVGDVSDVDWVRAQLSRYGASSVIHCAAYTSVNESLINPAMYYCNNVIGTLALLNAMVAEGVKQLIFSSTCAVHGYPETVPMREEDPCRPITPYGRSKWMMEQVIADYADAYGMKFVNLRYFNAAGADPEGECGEWHEPETHAIPLAIMAAFAGKPFKLFGTDYPTPDGSCVRDYIHVTDLAEAHARAVEYLHEGGASETMNIGTGVGTSVREVVRAVGQAAGLRLTVEECPRRAGDPPELVADASKARALLNFIPVNSSIDFIAETAVEWHKRMTAGQ